MPAKGGGAGGSGLGRVEEIASGILGLRMVTRRKGGLPALEVPKLSLRAQVPRKHELPQN